jgi:chemotaxis protein histidine kinase CheA
MNPEEYQAPQPEEESLVQKEEQSPTNEELDSFTAAQDNASADSPSNTKGATSSSNASVQQLSGDEIATKLEQATPTPNLQQYPQENQTEATQHLTELQQQQEALKQEIAKLQSTYQNLQAQMLQTQVAMGKLVQEALSELEQRKQTLQLSVEQLERRQERIRQEMRTTFAGVSQDLAIRIQGFKDYLTGSLQDLVTAAEALQLVPKTKPEPEKPDLAPVKSADAEIGTPQFAQQQFQDTTKQIRRLLDQYRQKPDYYGPPWQLRRTFEPIHAERVSDWFFKQGGRGALRTTGSRLQNILISSAIISILYQLYGDRLRTLVLANTPERLGEWRRGLQDCLGIGRQDFGPDRGVTLFETPEAVAQRADRLQKSKLLPLIVIDDSEEQVSLALLQFPLWLAFVPDPRTMRSYEDDF